MHLLYLDDAGSAENPDQKHFVLAGISVFERQAHFLSEELDKIAHSLEHHDPANLELHANVIFNGRNFWRRIRDRADRIDLLKRCLSVTSALRGDWRLFGVCVDKTQVSPDDPVEFAFEHIINRFDRYLQRLHLKGNTQRGLIILDKSSTETRIQTLASEFRRMGHRWSSIKNIADVPFFVDSKATRCIQYADLVAYALFRYYERDDDTFFSLIQRNFDADGGVIHGLYHYRNLKRSCLCPACHKGLFEY